MIFSTTATVGGRSVHYLETDGRGPEILLAHGNSSSAESFRRMLDSELGSRFHCVAVDFPGHGLSEPAIKPAEEYTIPGYGRFLRSFVQHLGLADIFAVGASLGGHALLETANALPLRGLAIAGAPPLGHPPAFDRAFHPNPAAALFFVPELTDEQVAELAGAITDRPDLHDEVAAAIRATDPTARGALGQSAAATQFADEVEIVRTLSVPLMIIRGERDVLVNGEFFDELSTPPYCRIVDLHDAGHHLFAEKPVEVGKILDAFVTEISEEVKL